MQIAGRELNVGDIVYSLRKGKGIVKQISVDNYAVCVFGNVTTNVADGGYIGDGVRDVYNHDPILMDSPLTDVSKFKKFLDYLQDNFKEA